MSASSSSTSSPTSGNDESLVPQTKEDRTQNTTDTKIKEEIGEATLKENVGGGRSPNTSVSILEPVIRIERDDKNNYRIVAEFQLQVKINGFEKGYFKTRDKLFDFISLRYLYNEHELHELTPHGDDIVSDADVSENSSKNTSVEVGASAKIPAAPPTVITPSLMIHVGREKKLTVKRKMRSWRTGLSYEGWCERKSSPSAHRGEYRGENCSKNQYSDLRDAFGVRGDCQCHRNFNPSRCNFRNKRNYYNRCAHWFWQVQALPHFWTPEIYESYTVCISVARLVDHEAVDRERMSDNLLKYLHFDFILKTRLRELGWSLRDYFQPWRLGMPAEVRIKTDYGYPLGAEKVRFCVWACPTIVSHWPKDVTENEHENGVKTALIAIGAEPISEKVLPEDELAKKRDSRRESAKAIEERLKAVFEAKFHAIEQENSIANLQREINSHQDKLAIRAELRQILNPPAHHHRRHHHYHDHHHSNEVNERDSDRYSVVSSSDSDEEAWRRHESALDRREEEWEADMKKMLGNMRGELLKMREETEKKEKEAERASRAEAERRSRPHKNRVFRPGIGIAPETSDEGSTQPPAQLDGTRAHSATHVVEKGHPMDAVFAQHHHHRHHHHHRRHPHDHDHDGYEDHDHNRNRGARPENIIHIVEDIARNWHY